MLIVIWGFRKSTNFLLFIIFILGAASMQLQHHRDFASKELNTHPIARENPSI
jgi:hypothetical protein